MAVEIKTLTPEERAALLSKYADRFPERSFITVPGDDHGKPVRLPFVLGNPSGACRLPDGQRANPAWGEIVAAALKFIPIEDSRDERLAADCILWPDVDTYGSWCVRWPSLPKQVGSAVARKASLSTDVVVQPSFTESVPDAIAKAYSEHPRSIWVWANARGKKHAIVIDPPDDSGWQMFIDAMKKPDADHWRYVYEAAQAYVVGCSAPESVADLFMKHPGITVAVLAQVGALAGAAAEIELGEL